MWVTCPSQPYNTAPLTHPGEKVLLRFIGAGHDLHPLHHHGNNTWQIAKDGKLLESVPGVSGPDLAVSDFTETVAPGETIDGIWTWTGSHLGWDEYGHVLGVIDANPNHPFQPHEINAQSTLCRQHRPADASLTVAAGTGRSFLASAQDPPGHHLERRLCQPRPGRRQSRGRHADPEPRQSRRLHRARGPRRGPPPGLARRVRSSRIRTTECPFPSACPASRTWSSASTPAAAPSSDPVGPLPPLQGGFNPYNGYYFMFHSHNEKEIVNNNVFPGGMLTMMGVLPPGAPIP